MRPFFGRCLTAFSKLSIFWVAMRLSEDFAVRASWCGSDESILRLAENDESEACASILQIGHHLVLNKVKGQFHRNSFKRSL